MNETELMREREGLLAELARLDARREQLKAEIVRDNRTAGISKMQVALKQTERAELLQAREDVRAKIAGVNANLKSIRQMNHGAVTPESVAQRFLAIARRSLPKEMFQDMLDAAKTG